MNFKHYAVALFSAVAIAASALMAGPAGASTVTFNSGGGSYADCTFTCVQRLQQDYAASAFGASPVTITDVQFFASGMSGPAQTYTMTLGINTAGPSLSSNFATNLALNTQTFATMSIGPAAGIVTIDFSGSYTYDPSLGDLVVDVQCTSQACGGSPNGNFLQTFNVNRAYDFCSNTTAGGCGGVQTGYGIATVFLDGPAAPAPEPASLAVLGAGLAGLGLIKRRSASRR